MPRRSIVESELDALIDYCGSMAVENTLTDFDASEDWSGRHSALLSCRVAYERFRDVFREMRVPISLERAQTEADRWVGKSMADDGKRMRPIDRLAVASVGYVFLSKAIPEKLTVETWPRARDMTGILLALDVASVLAHRDPRRTQAATRARSLQRRAGVDAVHKALEAAGRVLSPREICESLGWSSDKPSRVRATRYRDEARKALAARSRVWRSRFGPTNS